jgi:two-component system, sensor histidine kinase RegB
VQITIVDDGPGFSPDVIDQLGDPYITTRGNRLAQKGNVEHGGLGLGIFIAKTLLERSGARLRHANRKAPEAGAFVTVEWPRTAFDAAPARALANPSGELRESLIGEA